MPKSSAGFSFVRFLMKLSLVLAVFGILFVVYLDIQVVKKFEGKKWSVPAKVYARPLELFQGAEISLKEVKAELERLNYQETYKAREPGFFSVKGNRLALQSRGFQFWDAVEPSRRVELQFNSDYLAEIKGLEGHVAPNILRLEPQLIGGIYPEHKEDRALVKLEQVPQLLVDALIAVEDRSFYTHHGVSFKAVARAMFVNVSSRSFRQGGSTLTQQLVKNFYLTSERTLSRKLVEALMAFLLELHFSKDEILQAYINEIYLGQSGGRAIHGFGLASQHYFGRPLQELKAQHIALLVGIVKGASWYNPRRHPERVKQRRNQVLDSMLSQQIITEPEASKFKQMSLGVMSEKKSKSTYPAFLDLVKRQLKRDYKDADLQTDGLKIFTTMDPGIQHKVESSIKRVLPRLERASQSQGVRQPQDIRDPLQTAVLVTQPQTAEVLAVVGDKAPDYAGFNRALDARRPIGSVVKPAVYLAALQQGYHLASMIEDSKVELDTPLGIWSPENFDLTSHGPVLMYAALANSYNQATVRLGLSVGVNEVTKNIRQSSGLNELQVLPSVLLGAVEMTPLEVTAMYQTIAANGFNSPLRSIRAVLTAFGEPLNRYPISVDQIFDEAEIYILNHALQRVVSAGTAKAIKHQLPEYLNLAGKTGTTDEQRDAWFVGYSGNYLTTVWVGKDNNTPTRLTGSSGALPLWVDIMKQLPLVPLDPLQPEGVEWIWVDSVTGGLSGKNCLDATKIPVFESQRPSYETDCIGKAKGVPGWLRRLFD